MHCGQSTGRRPAAATGWLVPRVMPISGATCFGESAYIMQKPIHDSLQISLEATFRNSSTLTSASRPCHFLDRGQQVTIGLLRLRCCGLGMYCPLECDVVPIRHHVRRLHQHHHDGAYPDQPAQPCRRPTARTTGSIPEISEISRAGCP